MKKIIKEKAISMMLCIIALIFALPSAAFAQTGISNEAEEHILNELRRARIPNAAIAVIQDGETSYIFRYSTHDTLFQIGSVSKSFTGFGVLLLEDMGLLSVNDPVNQHLPWFEMHYNGIPVPHEDITVYNLLQHTSGLISDERLFPRAAVTESTDEFTARLTGLELVFYPSERHVYGNLNYIILGLLIETVSGQSYDEFMTQHVLHPLGMYNTFTDMQRAYETGWVIGGNRLRFLQPVSWNPPMHPTTIPSGFIYSNITDMVRWAEVHLGSEDIPEQFVRVVQRSHENNHNFTNPFADRNLIYTAGWNVNLESGSIHHYGSTPGYSAALRMLPDSNTAVVILGNLSAGATLFGVYILNVIEGEPFSSAGMNPFAIIDIIYTVTFAICIVYIGFFIRFIAGLIKRLKGGKLTNRKIVFKIRWLIAPLIVIADIILMYISPSMLSNSSHEFALMFSPASYTPALIGLWVALVCSLCVFIARVLGLSPKKKQKIEK